MSEYVSELHPEFLSMSAINSLVGHNSSPRVVMDSSHFSAKMTLNTPDEKLIKSGIEYELGKYLNDARMPEDSVIKAIIPKYREDGKESPSYTVLFEYEKNGQIFIDYINVDSFTSQHNFFGNLLYKTEDFYNLGYNTAVPKGTILATTSSYGENGAYNFGLNASVAFMSHPAVAEDGFAVSESFLNRATFQSVLKRSINITRDTLPVNLYGDQDIFKFLPNIGEKVRPDGLLCALRQRNDWFSIGDMSTNNLSEVDVSFDNLIYVNPNSTVIDITVTKGNYIKNEFSDKITQQLDHYAHMLTLYHSTVVDKFDFIMKEKQRTHGSTEGIRLTPRLHTFITDVNIKLAAARNAKQKLCYRKIPIDQYRIDIVTTSTLRPNLGFKMSDVHG